MTERIDIVVTERGSRTVRRNIEDIGRSAERSQSGVNLLKSALLGFGALQAAREITRLADTYTNLQNRLKLVTTGTKNLSDVTQQLFAISNQTRSSYEATANLFSRVALSAKDLGTSQGELLQFTESLNKAVILSGASAIESRNAIIQLSQGIASGTLRGDELRSVLEQLPFVADVIARSLGVTRGELRKLGAEGKITAQVVLDAFKEARVEIADRFAETVPTLGQSFTVLQNRFLQALGAFDEANGVSRALSQALLAVSNNLDIVASGAQTVALVLGTQLARTAVPAAIGAFAALGAALRRNPLFTIATLVATGVSALISFRSQLTELGGEFGNLGNSVDAALKLIQDFATLFLQALQSLFPELNNFSSLWGVLAAAISGAIHNSVTSIDLLRASFLSARASVLAVWNNFPAAFQEIATRALNGAIAIVEQGINGIISLIETIPGISDLGRASFGRIAAPASTPVGDALTTTFQQESGALTRRFDDLRLQSEAVSLLEEEDRLLRQATESQRELSTARENGASAASKQGNAAEELGKKTSSSTRAIKDQTKALQEQSDFLENSFGKVFDKLGDAVADFVTTGKLDFKSLVNSIVSDITKLAIKDIFRGGGSGGGGLFSSLFGGGGGGGGIFSSLFGGGGGGGGLFSGLGSLLGFANGGAFTVGGIPGRDQNLLSVNNRPVARVSRGETVSVMPQGQRGGGSQTVVQMTVVTPDAESFQRSQGQIQARMIAAANRSNSRNN